MSGAATRWRLIELQRRRRAIDAGIGLLDRKREALLRALAEDARRARETRERLSAGLRAAYSLLGEATVEVGEAPALSAALAQPPSHQVAVGTDSVVGVRVPRLTYSGGATRPRYGTGGTCARLDRSAAVFSSLVPDVIRLAEEEAVERTLTRGLRRTTRTLNALRTTLLPAVDADIRAVASGLEEEERDEAIRWRAGRP